ncbi:MAG: ABC transporter permease, partial [Enterococcus malodoratus]
MRRKKFSWSTVYLIFVFILLYVPIFYLIFYSFNKGGNMNNFTSFTWEHYQNLFSDSRLISIVVQTFVLGFLSALLATIIGTFGAMGIYYTR